MNRTSTFSPPIRCRAQSLGLLLLAAAGVIVASGCVSGQEPLRLESRVDGTITTSVKLDGPIQMQVQGPMIRYEGTYVSDELYELVEVGKTTDDWLLAVLGEPTGKAPLRDGTEVWRWTYRPVEQTGSVFDFFGGSEKEPKLATRAVFMQVRAALVIAKWKG